jgi:hypothetical protein
MLCGGEEEETCCTHKDETDNLAEWNSETKNNIYGYIEGNIWLMKSIVNYYEDIIVLAKYIYLSPKSSKVCKEASEEFVKTYIFREELEEKVGKLNIFLKKLRSIRKGFYCSLCSVKNQKFFNSFEKKVVFSHDFC